MSDTVPFDWRSLPPAPNFSWTKAGAFHDSAGRTGCVGMTCRLLRAAVSFDEKGRKVGEFASGEEFKVAAISSAEPTLLYLEGENSSGLWSTSGVRPIDVTIVTETLL